MKTTALLVAGVLTGALGCNAAAAAEVAGAYPAKPIRFLVPYPPGGSTDPIVRIVGQRMSDSLRQQMVVDNRGGASGNIANEIAAKASPDGYTLLLGTVSTISINASLFPKLSVDPIADLAAVSLIVSGFYLLVVHPSHPAGTVQELVNLARAKQGPMVYASGGTGSAPHLAMELLKQMAKIDLAHVPYKGTGPALNDLVGGHVPALFGSPTSIVPLMKAGRVKVLATTAAKRTNSLPNVPTVAEAGYPGYEVDAWYGLFVPAKTPGPVVETLHREVVGALQNADVRSRLSALGLEPVGNSPREFTAIVRNDYERWSAVIKRGGIRAQ
jgi:tripartite-type tricarboxylate transporter receptor subunit TctC